MILLNTDTLLYVTLWVHVETSYYIQSIDDFCNYLKISLSNVPFLLPLSDILEKHAETLECKESFNKCHEKSLAIEIHYVDNNERHTLARVRFPYDPDVSIEQDI